MIKNEKLRETIASEIRERRRWTRTYVKDAFAKAARLDATAQILDEMGIDWFGSTAMIYVRLAGENKAAFSAAVKKLAQALGEPPSIKVNPREYIAEFPESLVHAYLAGAEDCQVIEVEEATTRKVLKPHPACKAALATLEDIAV
jgi:hypothetical protein